MKLFVRTCLLALLFIAFNSKEAHAEPQLIRVEATAYCNPAHNLTYSGNPTVEGVTLGGKKEWIGENVLVFYEEDGEPGQFYGYMEFQDTGSGRPSRNAKGKSDIEMGETIDIYMDSYDDCIQWGRRKMYILFIGDMEFV